MLLNVGFSIEMRNMDKSAVGGLGDVQQGGKDDMRNTSFLGYIRNVSSLSNFDLRVHGLPVVSDEEDGVRPLDCLVNGILRIEIGLREQIRMEQRRLRSNAHVDELDSLLSQSFGRWLGIVSGHSSDLELLCQRRIGEDMLDDRSALIASGTEDCDDLGHVRLRIDEEEGCAVELD